AATDKGVCAIEFGDDPEPLLRALQDRFPKAQLLGGDQAFDQLVAKIVGFVEAPAQGLDLPLDIRGTAFQQRVWKAIRDIPAGATQAIGNSPSGSACPKPCARWHKRVARMASPSLFPATGWCAPMGQHRVIAGALRASALCWHGRRRYDPR